MNCVESKTEALSRSCQQALYIASSGADAIEEIRDKMGDPMLTACFTGTQLTHHMIKQVNAIARI